MSDSASDRHAGRTYVVGTCDTKAAELHYVRDLLTARGCAAVVLDLSTHGAPSEGRGTISPQDVAASHPGGSRAVFTGDRGRSIRAMAEALTAYLGTRGDVAGVIGIGGSGGTALIAPALRALPIGLPKMLVSTVASGDVGTYVGGTDIAMVYSVTDMEGLNRVSRVVLGNAAEAMAGMIAHPVAAAPDDRPALGLTMFGVTTPCVDRVVHALDRAYDCLVFHATGIGGRAMERLAESGMIAAFLDVTTTEVADRVAGGIFACDADRMGAVARTKLPYIGSCGALDMVNFGPRDTVPERYRDRVFVEHNPQITLMRTSPAECATIGAFIADRLNACAGDVRFFLPEGGLSGLSVPGGPFHDPQADAALFDALERNLEQTARRRLIRLPYAINDAAFADALVASFLEIGPKGPSLQRETR